MCILLGERGGGGVEEEENGVKNCGAYQHGDVCPCALDPFLLPLSILSLESTLFFFLKRTGN
jgi:hypothetical protein